MYRKLILLGFLCGLLLYNSYVVSDTDLSETKTINVEVRGETEKEGIYEVPSDATMEDLFDLCEVSENGDISSFSLQEKLYNRELIVIPEKKEEKKLISINSADIDELVTLPGIGPATAEKIIEYRQTYGSFLSLEDIMNVKGIGTAKYERIKDYITL